MDDWRLIMGVVGILLILVGAFYLRLRRLKKITDKSRSLSPVGELAGEYLGLLGATAVTIGIIIVLGAIIFYLFKF